MSISASLSNALSGLTAASRKSEVISANVSNALTEGYGRRDLTLTARSLGGNGAGVQVRGVSRQVDETVLAERRLADASFGSSSTAAGFYRDMEKILGLPDDPASVTGRITRLESALIEAASRPDSEARLQAVVDSAKSLAGKIGQASGQIQDLRLRADSQIANQVQTLNDGLQRIATLNHQIRVQLGSGHDATALMDQRQQVVDTLSSIVPLRKAPRPNGEIALYTTGGAVLLDGRPASIGFTPVGAIVPQMTLASGALSGLTLNGQPVSTSESGPLGGGSLSALFTLRDDQAVTAQQQLDGLARDLLERFADPTVDPTLTAGSPGLFTDAGQPFNAANELGLSARLAVNASVDPNAGGALWRLRDGIGATSQGPVGNATLLVAMGDALRAARVPASGGLGSTAQTAVGLAGVMVSRNNVALRGAEQTESFTRASLEALKATELRGGVDTDHEMQQLLLVEQAYSANARVITTIEQMINRLLEI